MIYTVWMCTLHRDKNQNFYCSLEAAMFCWLSFLQDLWFCGFSFVLPILKPYRLLMRSPRLWPKLPPWRVSFGLFSISFLHSFIIFQNYCCKSVNIIIGMFTCTSGGHNELSLYILNLDEPLSSHDSCFFSSAWNFSIRISVNGLPLALHIVWCCCSACNEQQ